MATGQAICYISTDAGRCTESIDMADFTSFSALRSACLDLPSGNPAASAEVARREAVLTKPPGSLGRLEELVGWLAHWQGRAPPQLQQVEILVFAGNPGVTGRGVSAYPAEVTAQMVANFAAGGAAINQLARTAGAQLRVIPLSLDRPSADFTRAPALSEQEFLAAVTEGYKAVAPACDLLCLGEMGIGNTTAAAAIAAALFGGGAARWGGMPPCCTNRSRSPRRSAGVNSPPYWVRRWRRGGNAFPSCSTVLFAPPRSRRWRSCGPTRLPMRCPAMFLPKPAIACCSTNSDCIRSTLSICGSAKRRAPPLLCSSCARRWPATSAWRRSPRQACRISPQRMKRQRSRRASENLGQGAVSRSVLRPGARAGCRCVNRNIRSIFDRMFTDRFGIEVSAAL